MPGILNQSYEMVPTGALREHPENANRGDVDVIAESIEENGFFGAIVAQRSSGHILVGNHRFRQLVAAGHADVPTIFVDVDDERARRIMLVDNASARKGYFDDRALLALLDNLARGSEDFDGALVGTGYNGEDYMALIERVNASPVIPTPSEQSEPELQHDHMVEIYCSADALAQFRATLERWDAMAGVTVNIS